MTLESPPDVVLPPAAVPYVLLQRPRNRRFDFGWLKPLRIGYYPHVGRIESRLRRRPISQGYTRDITAEYAELVPYLPSEVGTILDVGCGMAVIDVLFHHHYAARDPRICLLDKSTVTPGVHYQYRDRPSAYSSLPVARRVLEANGVPADRITCLEANDEDTIDLAGPVDLVVSLLSWGHHYPVATYLPEVRRILSPTGTLILDVRKETPGLAELERAFDRLTVVSESPKAMRVMADQLKV